MGKQVCASASEHMSHPRRGVTGESIAHSPYEGINRNRGTIGGSQEKNLESAACVARKRGCNGLVRVIPGFRFSEWVDQSGVCEAWTRLSLGADSAVVFWDT